MKIGSLFTGYGGLDLAVEQCLNARTVWACDNDEVASMVIARRFAKVPNLGDITAVDFDAVARVDVITAGWPCQPWSTAGRQKGLDDDRALWPHVARAVRVVRPRFVVLENVPNIARAGELERVVASLAAFGYVGSWLCVRAADVGAPHNRARIFVVARDANRRSSYRWAAARQQRQTRYPSGHSEAADTERSGRDRRAGNVVATSRRRNESAHSDHAAADTDSVGSARRERRLVRSSSGETAREGLQRQWSRTAADDGAAINWGEYRAAIEHWAQIIGRQPTSPFVISERGNRQLSPRFEEWMMGLPDGWVSDVEGVSRNQACRVLGQGVVPQQAVMAIEAQL